MNSTPRYCLGAVGILKRLDPNPFRPAPHGPPSYLIAVKPPSALPIAVGWDPLNRSKVNHPPPKAARMEARALKLMAGLLVIVVTGCAFGMQHIAYTRQMVQLHKQLKQKETEVRALDQARQSLKTSLALQVAQNPGPETRAVAFKLVKPRVMTVSAKQNKKGSTSGRTL